LQLSLHHRYVAKLLELGRDRLDTGLKAGEDAVRPQHGKLCRQHKQIELLGGQVVVYQGARQASQMLGQLRAPLGGQPVPGRPVQIFLHEPALGPHDEVVQAHAGDLIEQPGRQVGA
jgi:hypothetical protein